MKTDIMPRRRDRVEHPLLPRSQSYPGPSLPANKKPDPGNPKHLQPALPRRQWRTGGVAVCAASAGCIVLVMVYGQFLLATRDCKPHWKTIHMEPQGVKPRIALVTLAEQSPPGSAQQADLPARQFDGVMDSTWKRRVDYGTMHGYDVINSSNIVNRGRPPSWSKILAVQKLLPSYDWVVWMDADTVVTNLETKLEEILPSGLRSPELVLTKDAGGYNAGIWALRNTKWSEEFLEQWWSMTDFIRPRKPGETKSGDNDALKHYLAEMGRHEMRAHVAVAPQCAFNSYAVRVSLRNVMRLLAQPASMVQGIHRPGDFILHLAGIDDKQYEISRLPKLN